MDPATSSGAPKLDQVIAFLAQYGQFAWGYLSQPVILIQLGIVGLLFLPALFLSWRIESQLEERARGIKGMPGLLRLVVVFCAGSNGCSLFCCWRSPTQ